MDSNNAGAKQAGRESEGETLEQEAEAEAEASPETMPGRKNATAQGEHYPDVQPEDVAESFSDYEASSVGEDESLPAGVCEPVDSPSATPSDADTSAATPGHSPTADFLLPEWWFEERRKEQELFKKWGPGIHDAPVGVPSVYLGPLNHFEDPRTIEARKANIPHKNPFQVAPMLPELHAEWQDKPGKQDVPRIAY